MVKHLSVHLSESFAKKGIFPLEDKDVYAYGFELLLATVFNILILIFLSVIFAQPLAWVFFLLPFIPMRLTAGGYHAHTHLMCGITFCSSFAILMLISIYLFNVFTPVILFSISVICLIVTLIFSPIPASNKPQTETQRKKNRIRSIIISILCILIVSAGFLIENNLFTYFIIFTAGQLLASVSLIVGRIIIFYSKS